MERGSKGLNKEKINERVTERKLLEREDKITVPVVCEE